MEESFTDHANTKLLQPLMVVGATAAVSQLLVMLQTLLLARWLGPERNALVTASYSIAGLGFILISWGFDHWLLQKTARKISDGKKYLSTVLSVKLALGLVLSALFTIGLPQVKAEVYQTPILFLVLVDTLADSVSNSFFVYLLATNRFRKSATILVLGRSLRLIGTMLLVVFKTDSLIWFLGLRLVTDFLVLFYLWLPIKPVISLKDKISLKSLGSEAWPFGVAEVLTFLYDRLDLTILALLTVIPREISYYGVAMNITLAAVAILQTLQNVLVPYMIKQERSSGGHPNVVSNRLSLLSIFVVGIAGSSAFYLFGSRIVELLMGPAYLQAGFLVKLSSPLIVLKAVNVVLSSFLIAHHKEKRKLFPLFLVTVVKISLILILYSRYGLVGMIATYIVTEALLLLFYLVQVMKKNSSFDRTYVPGS